MLRRLREFLVGPLALVSGLVVYFGVLAAGVSAIGGLAKRDAQVGAALLANVLRDEPTATTDQPHSVSIGQIPVDPTAFEHARPAPRFVEQHEPDEIEQMKREVSERVVHDDPSPWRASAAQTTYKTMCVRICDGAYFPISFATTRDRFADDEAACRSRCGSPARLFVFPNPGGSPESMQDRAGRSYIALPTAFQFRQGTVEGCSCRAQPWEIASKERHRLYALEADREKGLTVDVAELDALRERHGGAQVPKTEADARSAGETAAIVDAGTSEHRDVSPRRTVLTAALGVEAQPGAMPRPQAAAATPAVESTLTVGALPPPPVRVQDASAVHLGGGVPSEPPRGAGGARSAGSDDPVRDGLAKVAAGSTSGQHGARSHSKSRSKAAAVAGNNGTNSAAAPSKLPRMISFQYDETVIWGVGRNAYSAPRGGSAHDAFARNFY